MFFSAGTLLRPLTRDQRGLRYAEMNRISKRSLFIQSCSEYIVILWNIVIFWHPEFQTGLIYGTCYHQKFPKKIQKVIVLYSVLTFSYRFFFWIFGSPEYLIHISGAIDVGLLQFYCTYTLAIYRGGLTLLALGQYLRTQSP